MQTETLRVQDLNLHYLASGTGPDVLFIHGWASSCRMWQGAMEFLAPHFRCWAIDLAGFGDSDKPANGWYTVPNFTAYVRAFAREAGIERAHVVGHSMGGMIALDLAATHRDFVQRLVVVNPVVTGRTRLQVHRLINRGFDRPLLSLTMQVWPVVVKIPFGRLLAAQVGRNPQDLTKATIESALGGLRALTGYDTTPRLPQIAAPSLVVVGARDLVVSPREGRLAAERVPDAQLVVMPTGHSPVDDKAAEFNSLLSSFLAAAA